MTYFGERNRLLLLLFFHKWFKLIDFLNVSTKRTRKGTHTIAQDYNKPAFVASVQGSLVRLSQSDENSETGPVEHNNREFRAAL